MTTELKSMCCNANVNVYKNINGYVKGITVITTKCSHCLENCDTKESKIFTKNKAEKNLLDEFAMIALNALIIADKENSYNISEACEDAYRYGEFMMQEKLKREAK